MFYVCLPAWLPGQTPADAEVSVSSSSSHTPMCLAIQWMASPSPAHPSGLYWQSHQCSTVGGYVCKRGNQGKMVKCNLLASGCSGITLIKMDECVKGFTDSF